MRSFEQSTCPNCNGVGEPRYVDLQDHLFRAPGRWSMRHCLNRDCGAFWLDPAPTPEDLPVAYREYYTHVAERCNEGRTGFVSKVRSGFVERRLGYTIGASATARRVAMLAGLSEHSQAWLYEYFYLPSRRGGRLFEIGCGSGRQLLAMRAAGWDVQGVDFDPEAVAVARSGGLDVAVGDVRDLDLDASQFDAIVMAHVLEHVFDPIGLLTECNRLLKPGGTLVSITPNGASLGHRIFKRAWRGIEPPRHIVVFTPRALRLACERSGLALDRVDVTARDAANMLLASSRTRAAADGEQIEPPSRNVRIPLVFHGLAFLERLGDWFGLDWGEELILRARKR